MTAPQGHTPPDFLRMADEYAAPGKVAGTSAIRRRAFLAGVNAGLEGADLFANRKAAECMAKPNNTRRNFAQAYLTVVEWCRVTKAKATQSQEKGE